MMNQLHDQSFENISINVSHPSETCTIYDLSNGEGTGRVISYQVFPGIRLNYNDFHMGTCPNRLWMMDQEALEINHCREGRFECEFPDGLYTYLSEGDLAVNRLTNHHVAHAAFPLEHYHGVSVLIELEEAAAIISTILPGIAIDVYALRDKLCVGDHCFIIRTTTSIQHIFSELYTVPDAIKCGYLKVKVLELLLFLSAVNAADQAEERPYFPKSQVGKIKQIKELLTQHMACHFTLGELSRRFELPLTAMNACFKAVYGLPIYTYARMYRMQAAAAMLLSTQDSITVIAGNVGYENPSKFAGAFKAVLHMSPSAYRKSR